MATSSELTTGDALVMAADVIKLLAPVLKQATKAQIQRLKGNSTIVQNTFGRMLNGEKPVADYGWVEDSYRILNKTGLEFSPNLHFTADAVAMERYPDTFNVTITIPSIFEKPLLMRQLFKPINWLGCRCDGFVSIDSALSVKSPEQAKKLRNTVQSALVTERMSLTFLKHEEAVEKAPDTYIIRVKLDGSSYECTVYLNAEELKPLLKR